MFLLRGGIKSLVATLQFHSIRSRHPMCDEMPSVDAERTTLYATAGRLFEFETQFFYKPEHPVVTLVNAPRPSLIVYATTRPYRPNSPPDPRSSLEQHTGSHFPCHVQSRDSTSDHDHVAFIDSDSFFFFLKRSFEFPHRSVHYLFRHPMTKHLP